MGSRKAAPQPYRGPKSPADFVAEIGNVWIGLIEKIASDTDQNEALAGYFGVEPGVIQDWIEARGPSTSSRRSCGPTRRATTAPEPRCAGAPRPTARRARRTIMPFAGNISPHVLRQSTAMELLRHGVDQSVIALWLGHESVETAQVYLHADMKLKEQALSRMAAPALPPGRYRPDDQLLAFLEGL